MSTGDATTNPTSSVANTGADHLAWLPNQTQFFLLLLSYFALHTILRGLISETAGIDDCDQIVRAQFWSWGYGPQPPLYTWLLKISLSVFGYNILAVTAVKEVALFLIYLVTYASARLITGSHPCGVAAAVIIQFNPSIAWESHRELTHSILTSLFVLMTIYYFLKLEKQRWKDYLLFAFSVAMGTLSKYNYLIFVSALLLAGVTLKNARSRVLNQRMAVALIVATLLCAPHASWIWQHRELAFSSVHKFKMDEAPSWWAAMGKALPKWIIDLIAHVGPTLGLFGLVFAKGVFRCKNPAVEGQVLWRSLLWILGVVTASILLFKVTGFRDRWLQPLFVWLPILLVLVYRDQITALRLRILFSLGVVIGLVVLLVAPGRVLLTERLKKNEILNTPYRQLAHGLKPMIGSAETIIASDYRIAGNLRLWFPDKFVASPEFADLFPRNNASCVVVWDTNAGILPAKSLLRFTESITGKSQPAESHVVSAVLKYHQSKTIQLGIAALQ